MVWILAESGEVVPNNARCSPTPLHKPRVRRPYEISPQCMAQMRIIKPNKFLDVFYPNEEQLFCWAGDAAWGKALVSSRDAEMIVLGPLDSQVPRPPMSCHSYTGYNVLHAPSLLLRAHRSDYHRRKYKQFIVSWCHDLFRAPQSPKISCKGSFTNYVYGLHFPSIIFLRRKMELSIGC